MQRLQRSILVFAVLFAAFVLGPPLLDRPFALYPLMKLADAFDLLTPLVLIPIYWRLFQLSGEEPAPGGQVIAFMILAALWVEGHGIHLAANSIGHLTESMPGTALADLTHFYDETLSHFMWHAAVIGFAALLVLRQWCQPLAGGIPGLAPESGAGILHGLNYALMVLEGGTTLIGVPFALLFVVFVAARGRARLRRQPVVAFFFVAFGVALLVFLGWGLYWGGLVEPSAVGLI
jgi:hypothetical protein